MKMSSLLCFFICALAAVVSADSTAKCKGKAYYLLKVKYAWSADCFPNRPESPHFSPLTVFSFANRYSAFSRLGYASPGVKTVAETGDPTMFLDELRTANMTDMVRNFTVDPYIRGPTDTVYQLIDVDCRRRYIGALTMVAPSPDWVLAIFRRSVIRDGKYIDRISDKLYVYDAGTDSGETFTADDMPTSPVQNIGLLLGQSFYRKHLATFTLTKM